MKKQSRYLAFLFATFSPVLLAEEYTLVKNESISQLLYDRLKISPIYKNGYLKKVLQYNDLTEKQSRSLPPGTIIYLPPSKKHAEEKIIPKTPEAEVVKVVSENNVGSFYVGLTTAVEMIDADIEPSQFTSTFLYPQVHVGYISESKTYAHKVEASASYVNFKKDEYLSGDNQILNAGLFYQLLKKQNDFRYGLKLSLENSLLPITSEDQSSYEIKNPLLYSVAPSIQWKRNKYITEVNLPYSPSQTIDSHNDLKNGLGVQVLIFRDLSETYQLGILGQYSKSTTTQADILKKSLGISVRYHF